MPEQCLNSLRRTAAAVLILLSVSGCSTYSIQEARTLYYRGRAAEAAQKLEEAEVEGVNRSLLLMERGVVYQSLGQYDKSIESFLEAQNVLDRFRTYSVSKGATSMVANDMVQEFFGYAYERTMAPVFAAQSYLAIGDWENAAVEARKAIKTLQPTERGDIPSDAYTHYLIGLCFELIDDPSNAALHYRKADERRSRVHIAETGQLTVEPASNRYLYAIESARADPPPNGWTHELVCLVMTGEALTGEQIWSDRYTMPPRNVSAEILIDGQRAGQSYPLTDIHHLAIDAANRQAAAKLAKTAARVAIKDAVADSISEENVFLGALIRLILIGILEQPDTRRWETLPRYLGVARVPCPPNPETVAVQFKNSDGMTRRTIELHPPFMCRRNLCVTLVRDLIVQPSPGHPTADPASAP